MKKFLKKYLEDEDSKLKPRLTSLPKSELVSIRDIRTSHIDKIIYLEGQIKRKTNVRPRLKEIHYLCSNPSCTFFEEKIRVPQFEEKTKVLKSCPKCKSQLNTTNRILVDSQALVLEEIPERLKNADEAKKINILLEDDLVSPFKDQKTNPGSRVKVIGILKELPKITRSGAESVNFEIVVLGISIELLEDDFSDIKINEEEEKEIIELSKKEDIVDILVDNFAPSIYKNNKIKEAITLQMFGGTKQIRDDGVKIRGDLHVLLIGDPGAAKSQMLKAATQIAPRSSYVSGKSASGVGLCIEKNSLIPLENGEIFSIKDLIDKNMTNPKKEKYDILSQSNFDNFNITTFEEENYKIKNKKPKTIFKIPSPKELISIDLNSGKNIKLTENTKLLTIDNNLNLVWKKSKDFLEKEYIITTNKLNVGTEKNIKILDLIDTDFKVLNIKKELKSLLKKISNKITIRELSKKLNIKENNLYFSWIREDKFGNINFFDLKKIVKISNELKIKTDILDSVKMGSIYNGKNFKIPKYLSDNFLYVFGLLLGDGDFSKIKTNTYQIRLSNSKKELLDSFENVVKEFGLKPNLTKGNLKRPDSLRVSSKFIGTILKNLNMPFSPKSNKIDLTNIILKLNNKSLSNVICGIFDSDGSIWESDNTCIIDLTSTSKIFIEKIQLILLRYEIYSTIRKRDKSSNKKIKSNYDKYILEIRGISNIKKFHSNFKLKHTRKKSLLEKYSKSKIVPNTNIDIVPNSQKVISNILKKYKIKHKINLNNNLSKSKIVSLLKPIKEKEDVKKIFNIANSNFMFEKIKKVSKVKTKDKYVYDFTIDKTHSFIANGILVHNTASVIRDDISGGWALEAGSMVLANGGLCVIDEMDKMDRDDTSAMHEALEQQCYHYDFELLFEDGTSQKIGEYVENYFNDNKYKKKIIEGVDCQILEIKTKKVLTSDFNKIYSIVPSRISRHKSFDYFYKINYSNGKNIVVTPEHPVFIYDNSKNQIITIRADEIKENMIVPTPRFLKLKSEVQKLKSIKLNSKNKSISFPKILNKNISFFLGFFGAEGHSYKNTKNRNFEIGVSNTNEVLIDDFIKILKKEFLVNVNKNIQKKENRKKATKDLFTARVISKPFYEFFEKNFEEFLFKAPQKRVPNLIKKSKQDVKIEFLKGYYLGDGFYDTNRIGFCTSSEKMAYDLCDLLLSLKIYSYINEDKKDDKIYYKVVILGEENLEIFKKLIDNKKTQKYDFKKIEKIDFFLKRSKNKQNYKDLIPTGFVEVFNKFLKDLKISDGYSTTIIKRSQNSNRKVLLKYLDKANKKLKTLKSDKKKVLSKEFLYIKKFLTNDIRFIKVKNIQKIKNKTQKWVYDVTIPKTKTFISNGLILHNTISVSKANIRATLLCETSVLGAANPKYGRFNPYEDISKQIDFPPALISRFDLIFVLKDIPTKKRDDLIASHILKSHKNSNEVKREIDKNFIRKYIAYAKKINPILSDEAIEEIKNFYVNIRNSLSDEDNDLKAVPITARQLEAIIRLSEAYAKIKLSKVVEINHAKQAIALMMDCLRKIGFDDKTGQLDIDIITTGVKTSLRNDYRVIKDIIDELEKENEWINHDDIIKKAEIVKIGKEDTKRIIQKLKEEGIIFQPRRTERKYKKSL